MQVKEIMSSNPACCTKDTRLAAVARLMVQNDCGEIPVVDGTGRVVGVVTDRDIVCRLIAEGKNPVDVPAESCMSTPAVTVKPDSNLDEALKLMESRQIRRLPVVDSKDKCVGMLSQADIARGADDQKKAQLLEEVSQPT